MRCVFITNPNDKRRDSFAQMLCAGITQLIRTWRDKERAYEKNGETNHAIFTNQIIRHINSEDENARFAAGHAIRVFFREQCIAKIDLKLLENIGEDMVIGTEPNVWGFTLDANLISNYHLTQRVVPLMKEQGSGDVLNISSYFGGTLITI